VSLQRHSTSRRARSATVTGESDAGNLWPRSRLLPFVPPNEGRLAALRSDTDAPSNQDCLTLSRSTGVALDCLDDAASHTLPRVLRQFMRHRALRWMDRIDIVSAEMGAMPIPLRRPVTPRLASRDGQQRTIKRFAFEYSGTHFPRRAKAHFAHCRENIGYLRIPSMIVALTAGSSATAWPCLDHRRVDQSTCETMAAVIQSTRKRSTVLSSCGFAARVRECRRVR